MSTFTSVRMLPVAIISVAVALSACAKPARPAATTHQLAPTTTSPTSTPATSARPTTAPPPSPATPPASNDSGLDSLPNATLDLPGWGPGYTNDICPSGPTKFTNGRSGANTKISYAGTSDVDRDGVADIVALIGCQPGEGTFNQAIAFHRNANGSFTTIGLITAPYVGAEAPGNHIYLVGNVHLHPDGTVGVDVGNYETGFTEHAELGIWQTRSYRWDGHRFVQVAGPTSFNAPTWVHLSLTVSPMHFRKPAGGSRTGSIRVTISNTGTRTVAHVSALLVLEGDLVSTGTGCTTVAHGAESCGDLSIAAGKTVTLTLPIKISVGDVAILTANFPVDQDTIVQIRVDGFKSVQTSGLGRTLFDSP